MDVPAAVAWAEESWQWYSIAQWVRWMVRMEGKDASAANAGIALRLAEDIGMTAAGLRLNHWQIDNVPQGDDAPEESSSAARMTVVQFPRPEGSERG